MRSSHAWDQHRDRQWAFCYTQVEGHATDWLQKVPSCSLQRHGDCFGGERSWRSCTEAQQRLGLYGCILTWDTKWGAMFIFEVRIHSNRAALVINHSYRLHKIDQWEWGDILWRKTGLGPGWVELDQHQNHRDELQQIMVEVTFCVWSPPPISQKTDCPLEAQSFKQHFLSRDDCWVVVVLVRVELPTDTPGVRHELVSRLFVKESMLAARPAHRHCHLPQRD